MLKRNLPRFSGVVAPRSDRPIPTAIAALADCLKNSRRLTAHPPTGQIVCLALRSVVA
jgi:hypothetical protein